MASGSNSAIAAASSAVILTSNADLFPPDGFGPHATRDASGNFQVHYVIPATTPAGTYSIGMRCGGGNVGITTTLRVTGARTTLPATGPGSVGTLIALSAALLMLGVLLTGRRGTSDEALS